MRVSGPEGESGGPAAAGQSPHGYRALEETILLAQPNLTTPQARAAEMLRDEIARRTRRMLPIRHSWPEGKEAVLAVGTERALRSLLPVPAQRLLDGPAPGPEGYRLTSAFVENRPIALAAGADARGALFAAGKLLRSLRMERDSILLPGALQITTTPRFPLRGHQLGYRPKTNSYDAWTLGMWEQYLRDLIVFGANAVELIPPRSDDQPDSPHFPLPPLQMLVEMSRLIDSYGLEVWVWFPALDADYRDPVTVEGALAEWSAVFQAMPRIDALFVPGGDPGHTDPAVLMTLLEKQAAALKRWHPAARVWTAPQGFSADWMESFLQTIQANQPDWLAGVVHGPQVRLSPATLRARLPDRYLLRLYPDITHCCQCQFPVPDWDIAWALTAGREGINPRPVDQARIFRKHQDHMCGFITYSEGCNDDVNKAVWSALGWDPAADVTEVLREYGRYFVSDRLGDAFAQGLLALESSWKGPLLAGSRTATVLRQFQEMERSATPQVRLNWRFQQALYRAYYDAYIRCRLLSETSLEERAWEVLRAAPETGAWRAIAEAEAVLNRALSERPAADLRARVFELAEALYQSIRMQLSVNRYQAIAVERGANLDSLDAPLNSRIWLQERFAGLRNLPSETERLDGIRALLDWISPGPGGFYDAPGDPACREHLLTPVDFEEDPGCYTTARVGFSAVSGRLTWKRHIETLYDTPLRMRWVGLDPEADYSVRVVYGLDNPRRKIRLTADGDVEIHPLLERPSPPRPLTFAVPAQAIVDGALLLSWTMEPGFGGNGRGCQICEIWLIRRSLISEDR